MPVCPKCGFSGQDQDTCERCGVIYARMHTILEIKPASMAAALARAEAARTPAGPMPKVVSRPNQRALEEAGAKPVVDFPPVLPKEPSAGSSPDAAAPRPIPSIVQAFPGAHALPRRPGGELTPGPQARTEREVTLVPIVPPPPRDSGARLRGLLVILVVVASGWGFLHWREARARAARLEAAEAPADSEYFDLRIAQIIEDTQHQLRQIKDPEAATKARDALSQRVRFLRVRLETSSLSDARKEAVGLTLDELQRFLKSDVGAVITAVANEHAPAAASGALNGGVPTSPAAASAPAGSNPLDLSFEKPGAEGTRPATASSNRPAAPAPTGQSRRVDLRPLDHLNDELASLPP